MKLHCDVYNKDHELILLFRKNEIIFALPNGKEVANIKVCTMINENEENTKNFFLLFNATESPEDKSIAHCVA